MKKENSERPIVLAIGGSDSAGLAGLQRDNTSILALSGHAMNVVTANTAQNAQGVVAINPVEGPAFCSQLDAALASSVQAIKTGLLVSPAQLTSIASAYMQRQEKPPLVIDPVLAASSGESFSDDALIDCLVKQLLPLAALITPNISEAERLCGQKITSCATMVRAAHAIKSLGAKAVLIKGGHLSGEDIADTVCVDYFLSDEHAFFLRNTRIKAPNNRGTGCALASAIATALACGHRLADAVVIGKMAIQQGLRSAYAIAPQAGPVFITHFPNAQCDLPELVYQSALAEKTFARQAEPFPAPDLPNGESAPLGLYPVVETAQWVERVLAQGVATVQLRNKSLQGDALAQEVKRAVAVAERYNARLFINDHWQLAIASDAYGVHLGQEDLADADINAIRRAGLRLGISTHCHYEVARAHALCPSYIACGPVYPTTSKVMPWIPHGVKGFAYWRKSLDYPLVAIGGINRERIPDVVAAGADGVAMISAITHDAEPEQRTREFMELIHDARH